MKTWLQLKNEIRTIVFSSGEPENLKGTNSDGSKRAHELLFEEGMAHIQKWVKCEQDNNVNTYPACATWFKCGLTVFDLPCGIIDRVYTLVGAEWCDPVFYRETDWPDPEQWSRNLADYDMPLNEGFPRLPQGLMFVEKATDSTCGRARTGIWAKHKNRGYIAPWLQSYETLVIEWHGMKTSWADTDPVNPSILLRTALKLYFQYAHERDFGEPSKRDGFKKDYDDALADLMHECEERTRRRNDLDYDEPAPTATQLEDESMPHAESMIFAHIGNYANGSVAQENVASVVRSWMPQFIITSGNNRFEGNYDDDMSKFYHDYIFPYNGSYGDGAAVNLFWPAPGVKDWDLNALADYRNFFRLPNNERYYELVRGDVHFFFIDSDSREPDGNGPASVQKAWLAAKVALSTAVWKVVVQHHPPFSSAITMGSQASSQWDFAGMGIDLVLSAGPSTYERFLASDVNYIVNGLGGQSIEGFAASPEPNSQKQYNDEFGAVKLTATETSLTAEFWDRFGYKIDTLELTQ